MGKIAQINLEQNLAQNMEYVSKDKAKIAALKTLFTTNNITGGETPVDFITGLVTALNNKANTSSLHKVAISGSYNDLTNKPSLGTVASKNTGTASGNVPLIGSDGKIDPSILPALAITDTFPVSTEAQMLALVAQKGDVAVRSDISESFILKAEPASTLSNWTKILSPTSPVQSVNGKTGVVSVTKSDVGLGSVENYGVATEAEAKAGSSTSKYTTPASVKIMLERFSTLRSSVIVSDTTDWNKLTVPGVYSVVSETPLSSTYNAPDKLYGYGILQVIKPHGENAAVTQIYTPHNDYNYMVVRTGYSNASWKPWKILETTEGAQAKVNTHASDTIKHVTSAERTAWNAAEVNQNAFSTVKVGSTNVTAAAKQATIELVAGSNVTLTPDASTGKVTIAATNSTYSVMSQADAEAGTATASRLVTAAILKAAVLKHTLSASVATTSANGLMSKEDKTKLNYLNERFFKIPTGAAITWIKLAELTTNVNSGQSQVTLLIDSLGDFGQAHRGTLFAQFSTRGSSLIYNLLEINPVPINTIFKSVVNATSGKTEIWMRSTGYNYETNVLVLGLASATVGVLSEVSTEPANSTELKFVRVLKDSGATMKGDLDMGTNAVKFGNMKIQFNPHTNSLDLGVI